MSHYNTILSQVMQLIPRHQFEAVVKNQSGDRYVKRFNCWNQLTTMLYAQASGKESLREIEQGLAVNDTRLYHLGLPMIKRSTLADADQTRSHKIFESLFYKLLERCQSLTPKHKFKFKNPLYSIDATIIDLCLSVFSWAKFRTTKDGIKLHYQFDHSGHIPNFLAISDAKTHETTVTKNFFNLTADSYDSIYKLGKKKYFLRVNRRK